MTTFVYSMQMRVEELEAVCHAANFESSLRRAMANTSPICSVSPSTDSNASSQSCLHSHATAARHQQSTSGFQNMNFRTGGSASDVSARMLLPFPSQDKHHRLCSGSMYRVMLCFVVKIHNAAGNVLYTSQRLQQTLKLGNVAHDSHCLQKLLQSTLGCTYRAVFL